MATITFSCDRNASMDGSTVGLTETNASGATMTKGVELNVDLAKVTSKQEIIESIDKIKKLVVESINLAG
jgi:hypothetical protein